MRKLLFLIFLGVATNAYAQTRIIQGVVSDNYGKPVSGAAVVVKGTDTGVTTSSAGEYTINPPDNPESVLIFSFHGMRSAEVKIGSRNTINIQLEDDLQSLEQIVVVGYGSIKKSDLTGSVESVRADKLVMGSSTNAAQMLQGRVPGLYINSHDQDPGTTNEIMMRGVGSLSGSTQPLIVVDGFPADNTSVLNTINPNDIEQMDILKDASATAIYGSRGANGVILISTRKGSEGNLRVEYGGKFSIENIGRRLDLMNSDEYIRFYYDLAHDDSFSYAFPAGYEGESYPYPLSSIGQVANTDWQKEITNNNSFSTEQNLSLSGGSKYFNYRTSLNYYDGNGIVGPYEYKRINAATKLNYQKDKFAWSIDFNYTKENTNMVRNSFLNAVHFAPTEGKFGADGNLSKFPIASMSWYDNPYYNEYNQEQFSEANTTRLGASVWYEFIKGLKLEGRLGFQRRFYEEFRYENSKNNSLDNVGVNPSSNMNINADIILSYLRSFDRHNLNLMVAGNYQFFRNRGVGITGRGSASPLIKYYDMSSILEKENVSPSSYWNERGLAALLGRFTYDYDNRYYLTVNFREDAATQFGSDNKWGFFPSAAVAWRINNEEFFTWSYINNLKLTVGYGLSGNANVPAGRSQALIEYIPVYLGGPTVNGVTWSGGYRPNPKLQWEGSKTLNVGFEIGTKYFSVDINAYRKFSYQLLIDRPLPVESGYSMVTLNKGELVNYGLEARVSGFFNTLNGDLRWNPSAWVAYNKNELTNFDGSKVNTMSVWDGQRQVGYAGIMQEGYPMGAIFGYDYDGVWAMDEAAEAAVYKQLPGDPKFRDTKTSDSAGNYVADGPDGKIDAADRRFMGSVYPKVTLGFSSSLTYKNWNLSFMMDGVLNKKVVNFNRVAMMNPNNVAYGNLSREVMNRWTPDNQNTDIPSWTRQYDPRLVLSTFSIEDATFFRLRELTLSYQYDLKKSKFLKGLRVYVTGTNLFTLTNYTGLNPDILETDISWNLRPITRTFLLGINLYF